VDELLKFLATEWTGIIAALALLLSIVSLVVGRRADKVQRFAAIQEVLIGAEAQKGRRLLYEREAAGTWEHANIDDMKNNQTKDWESVTHSLALLALLAFMREQGWVPKRPVMAIWSDALRRLQKPAKKYIDYRNREEGPSQWPYLERMMESASASARSRRRR
jgi:hypothetical protein